MQLSNYFFGNNKHAAFDLYLQLKLNAISFTGVTHCACGIFKLSVTIA